MNHELKIIELRINNLFEMLDYYHNDKHVDCENVEEIVFSNLSTTTAKIVFSETIEMTHGVSLSIISCAKWSRCPFVCITNMCAGFVLDNDISQLICFVVCFDLFWYFFIFFPKKANLSTVCN